MTDKVISLEEFKKKKQAEEEVEELTHFNDQETAFLINLLLEEDPERSEEELELILNWADEVRHSGLVLALIFSGQVSCRWNFEEDRIEPYTKKED